MSPRSRVVRLTNLPTVQARGTARYCDPLRVAGCGRLTPQKHPEFFAAVARLSSAADLPFTFTWVGDGPAHYRKLLLRSGVTVTGWLSSDDVAKQLAQCTVFLHTALYEGSPFALLDAAALGLPVVGRPVPGLRELHWIRHMTTPRKALDVLQSMSGRENWSVSSQATTTAIHQLLTEVLTNKLSPRQACISISNCGPCTALGRAGRRRHRRLHRDRPDVAQIRDIGMIRLWPLFELSFDARIRTSCGAYSHLALSAARPRL
ncbi:MAG: glycosyltransferase [Chloroflexi bacterium]|nr:MAG: glycosyltransferase [Chloroflexota bacterium]